VSASRLSDWTNRGLEPLDRQNQIKRRLEKAGGQKKSFVAGTHRENNFLAKYPRIGPESPLELVQDLCSHLLILNLHAEMNTNTTTAVTRIMITVFLAQQYV
jgi:hypothetical protein